MKLFKILCFALILVVQHSCKDLFDRKPLDKIASSDVWNNSQLIDANLAQLYAETPLFYQENTQYSNEPSVWGSELFSDNNGAHTSWMTGVIDQTGGQIEFWAYTQIRDLNTFIQNVPNSPMDAKIKVIRVAEARFLRAFDYFEMVKRYGGVPIITVPQLISSPADELIVPRNSEKEVYDFIAKECDEISVVLPEVASEFGRVTKYVAMALKSRAMLYAGSVATFGKQQLNGLLGFPVSDAPAYWQKSYDASKAIVSSAKFGLFNKYPNEKAKNYQYIWLDERHSETIFSKVFNGKNVVGHSWDYYHYPAGFEMGWGGQVSLYVETVESYDKTDGSSGKWDYNAIQSNLISFDNLFKDKDPRFFGSALYTEAIFKTGKIYCQNGTYMNGISGPLTISNTVVGQYNGANWFARSNQYAKNYVSGTGFPILKFVDITKTTQPQVGESTTDYIIFRYGETLLNLAEAAFELGKADEALLNTNLVRARAGMPALTSIDRDKIRAERRIELAFEGHRFWDLRRWRIAVAELSKVMHKLKINFDWNTKMYQVIIEKADIVTRSFVDKQYYLPITFSRISNNPKLAPENPGY
jgi:hypothetical protein